jgi:glucosyl-3-phosphoglycerate phosphatase
VRRLVLLRHGESVWNAEGRIQGQRCEGLSDLGHEQARLAAGSLARAYPDAAVVTSDLPRCVETAAPLTAMLGVVAVHDRRLRERSFGDWEGRLRSEVAEEDADRWRRWLLGEDVVGEVGGESARELADRIEPVWCELLAATPDGAVTIAVTHGGPVWHGTHRVLGLTPGTLGGVSNASVTELIGWDAGVGPGGRAAAIVLDRWNEAAHLPVELRTSWRPRVTSDAPPVGR